MKLRCVILRLLRKGYVFAATKDIGGRFEGFVTKKVCLRNLKVYGWADVKEIYEPHVIEKFG